MIVVATLWDTHPHRIDNESCSNPTASATANATDPRPLQLCAERGDAVFLGNFLRARGLVMTTN